MRTKIQIFLEDYGLFISFLIGSAANGLPNLISDAFPNRRNMILLALYFLSWIVILFISKVNLRSKINWSIIALLLFLFFIWQLPGPRPLIEITSPVNDEEIVFSSNSAQIEIKGKVTEKILSRLKDGSLHLYIIKFDDTGQPYFESKEPVRFEGNGEWKKKLGFYTNQRFSLLAIAASSHEIALEHATTKKVYLSDIVSFNTFTK
jgi:hypothetical protein